MNKYSVDYSELQAKLSKKKAFLLSDVKHKIKKVAFDVVRFVDSDNFNHLWQVQYDGDNEYIVAMYDEEPSIKSAASSSWSAQPDQSKDNITVYYQTHPIKRISLASLGVEVEDVYLVCQSLVDKLTNDTSFYSKFANELSDEERKILKG